MMHKIKVEWLEDWEEGPVNVYLDDKLVEEGVRGKWVNEVGWWNEFLGEYCGITFERDDHRVP